MLRVGHEGGVARLPPPLLAPVRHQVSLEHVGELELAGRGALETLLGTVGGLDLGHGCFRVTEGESYAPRYEQRQAVSRPKHGIGPSSPAPAPGCATYTPRDCGVQRPAAIERRDARSRKSEVA